MPLPDHHPPERILTGPSSAGQPDHTPPGGVWRRFLNLLRPSAGFAPAAAPKPDVPVWVIGDLHGCATLLEALLAALSAQETDPRARYIFAGDLIDRGPDSAGVLARVRGLCEDAGHLCLMGNHERMMLDFLADPATHGARWMAAGGEATLLSYGLGLGHSRDMAGQYTAAAAALTRALPPGMADWIRARPLLWRAGNLVVAHAGADPVRPPEGQGEDSLLWGHYRGRPRSDGLWVVQGHIIVPAPQIRQGRVFVDTGAFARQRLSAVRFGAEGADLSWITVSPAGVTRGTGLSGATIAPGG